MCIVMNMVLKVFCYPVSVPLIGSEPPNVVWEIKDCIYCKPLSNYEMLQFNDFKLSIYIFSPSKKETEGYIFIINERHWTACEEKCLRLWHYHDNSTLSLFK